MYGVLSQLAHVELLSPKPEESAEFFKNVLGLNESGRDEGSIYLRAWGDFFHHSLVITESTTSGVAHVGWRTAGAEHLDRAVERIEAAGAGEGWLEAPFGHGRAYRFHTPGGHLHEIFWEAERFVAPEGQRSTYPIRPQRPSPLAAGVRHIDHITLGTPRMDDDISFLRDVLDLRFMEYTVLDASDATPFFAQLSNNEQAHDIALINDASGLQARSHHVAFWLDQYVDVIRAADALIESGTPIEFGPGRHGHGENTFLYFREPGGHRVELFSGGYRNYLPDWEPVRWVAHEGGASMFRNWPAPDSMTELFPDTQVAANIISGEGNPWALPGVS